MDRYDHEDINHKTREHRERGEGIEWKKCFTSSIAPSSRLEIIK
jgi:hypothetical protein